MLGRNIAFTGVCTTASLKVVQNECIPPMILRHRLRHRFSHRIITVFAKERKSRKPKPNTKYRFISCHAKYSLFHKNTGLICNLYNCLICRLMWDLIILSLLTDYVSFGFHFANNFKSNKIKWRMPENIFNFSPKIQVRKLQEKKSYILKSLFSKGYYIFWVSMSLEIFTF